MTDHISYNHSGQYRKRSVLVEQCLDNSIPACMGHYSASGSRVKCSTLGKMRRQLIKKFITPKV